MWMAAPFANGSTTVRACAASSLRISPETDCNRRDQVGVRLEVARVGALVVCQPRDPTTGDDRQLWATASRQLSVARKSTCVLTAHTLETLSWEWTKIANLWGTRPTVHFPQSLEQRE